MFKKSFACVLFIFTLLISFSIPISYCESEGWLNENTFYKELENGKTELTSYIGPQVFWGGSDWQELNYEDHYINDGFHLLQNAHVAVEVYDYYIKYFDPDYQEVRVYDERWEVQKWNIKGKGGWDNLGAQSGKPSYKVIQTEKAVILTKTFNSWAGQLNITYILRSGEFLKQDVIFESAISGNELFQVVMELSGIVHTTLTTSDGVEVITGERKGRYNRFVIGDEVSGVVFLEDLKSLGHYENDVWVSDMLNRVTFDTHAQGMKVNIEIGNFTLSFGESLFIDPSSSTFSISSTSWDGWRWLANWVNNWNHVAFGKDGGATVNDAIFGYSVAIEQGATIDTAFLSFMASEDQSGTTCSLDFYGEDVANATIVASTVDFDGRSLTSAKVDWIVSGWTENTWYNSTDITSIIQEVVNNVSWVSGNFMNIIILNDGSTIGAWREMWDYTNLPAKATKLYITWTPLDGQHYLDADDLSLSSVIVGSFSTVSINLETNSTPAFYWFGHNSSGAWENTTAKVWSVNGSFSDWFLISPYVGFPFGVIGYANSSEDFNATSLYIFTTVETVMWNELLFGDGFWLGLILIEAVLFIISASVRWGGYFSGATAVLMFMVYYQNLTANTFEYWGMILVGITAFIHIMIAISEG